MTRRFRPLMVAFFAGARCFSPDPRSPAPRCSASRSRSEPPGACRWATARPTIANALLTALQQRAQHPESKTAALAVFDFRYLVETYREATYGLEMVSPAIDQIDGYQLVLKAQALQRDRG